LLENKYLILAVLGIMGVVAVSGCTSNTSSSANTVTIQNFAFNPAVLNVQVGKTVTWTNKDSTTHHVVSDTGLFDSGNLSNGMSYNYTFNTAGNYPYHCSIHPSMKGTIVVTTNAPASPSTASNTSGSGTPGY
jgi:plastocyanin